MENRVEERLQSLEQDMRQIREKLFNGLSHDVEHIRQDTKELRAEQRKVVWFLILSPPTIIGALTAVQQLLKVPV